MKTKPDTTKTKGGKAGIDWEDLKGRLEKAGGVLAGQTAGDKKRILSERARRLAEVPDEKKAAVAEGSTDAVEFMLGKERYAIENSNIREVCPLTHMTPIPCTPAFVLGIMNVRGQMVSVIDLRKFFDLPDLGLTDRNKVIIICSHGIEVGVVSDQVVGVKSIAAKDFQQQLPTLTGVRERYLKGVTRDQTVVLDVDKLLSDKTIVIHEEVGG